jgi:hypothetical protein
MLRRLGIAIALVVGLLAAVAAALIVYRAEVAEAALMRWLAAQGAEAPALTVTGLDLRGLHLSGLSLGARGELRARAVGVAYTLEGLMDRRLDGVTVEGLALDLDLTGPEPPLGALGALFAGPGGPSDPGGLAPPPVVLSAARIEVASAAGPVIVDFDGEAWPAADGGLTGAITFVLNAGAVRLAGVAGLSTRDRRLVVGEAVIDSGSLDLPGATIGGLTGEVDVAVRADRPFSGAGGWLESVRARLAFTGLSLAQAPFERARLDLDLSERRLEVAAELQGAGPEFGLVLAGTIENYRTTPRLDLDLTAEIEAGAHIWELLAVAPPSAGRARASLRLTGPLPPRPALPLDAGEIVAWLRAGELRGNAEVAIDGLDYADKFTGLDAELTAEVALTEDVLELALPSASLRASALDPTLLAALGVPKELRGKLARNVAVELPEPLRLRLERDAAGATARLEGAVRLEAGQDLALDAGGEVVLDLGEGPPLRRFDLTRLKLRLRDLTLAGQRVERLGFEGAVTGRPGEFGGGGTLEARLPAVVLGGFEAGGIQVRLPATFHSRAGTLEAGLRAPGRVTLARLAHGALARPAGPLTFTLNQGKLARDGDAVTLVVTATAEAFELAPGASLTVAVNPGELRLDGALAAGGYRGRLRVEGARLAVPAHEIVADGVSATVNLDPAREGLDARFAIAAVRHLAEPAYVAPLRLAGRVGGDGETVTLDAEGFDGAGARRLRVSARHHRGRGRGEATVTLDPLTFAPDFLQPRDIFPVLGERSPVSGDAAAIGHFAWSPDGFDGTGVLELDDLSLSLQGIAIEGLRTRVTFDSLWPPSTPPGQIARIRRIDPALPLDDVRLRFRLPPSSPPRLLVERAEMEIAGGRFSVANAVLAQEFPSQNLILTLDEIDLSRLFELAGIDGLTGSGLIEGTIPVGVSEDGVVIREGGLRATGPGVLRYRSETAAAALQSGGAPVEMMLEALRDFRYGALSATIDMEANDDVNITLHVRGHNPKVLDGHPFAINIDLNSNLASVLAALREGAVLSGALAERARRRRP